MSATTIPLNTPRQGSGPLLSLINPPVAADTKIFQGSLAAIVGGYAVPASAAAGAIAAGRANYEADNTDGAAGDVSVEIERGTFRWKNSSSTDAIAASDVGSVCFVADDQTVAKTDGGGTRAIAGTIIAVDSLGVWVETSGALPAAARKPSTVSVMVALDEVANGTQARIPLRFSGRVKAIDATVMGPASTAGKATTLSLAIASDMTSAGTDVTGGALALTSANCGTRNAIVEGSAITAANAFVAGGSLVLKAANTTAFVEGAVVVVITLEG